MMSRFACGIRFTVETFRTISTINQNVVEKTAAGYVHNIILWSTLPWLYTGILST
jgi:hypothetical protein